MNRQFEGFLILVILVGLTAGGIVGWLGWQQRLLLEQGSATPQQIRLADLAAKGPGNNIHVMVTDYVFGPLPVIEKKRGQWNRVWIPLYPAGQKENPADIKVIVRSFNLHNDAELAQFYQQKAFTGVITNSIYSMGSGEVSELKKGYPGANFNDVWMIDEGRDFPTEGYVSLLLSIAGVLLVLGIGAIVWLIIAKARARRGEI
jgi:hypothetical protein